MFVSLAAMRASPADEVCLGDAVLAGCVSTVLAAVGGVPGVDLDPDTPSLFRFGAQYRDETPQLASLMLRFSPDFGRAPLWRNCPGLSGRARVWPAATCWRSSDPPPPARRNTRRARGPACGESPYAGWRSCDAGRRPFAARVDGSSSALRRAASRCCAAASRRRRPAPARIVDVLTVAGRGETRDPDVDTGLAASGRERIGRHVVTGEHQRAAPAPVV